mmetsp:Transcript_2685/g.8634  ORF Transcript_2685/g.8634 Transcript_2685/m.8634 type:complete len:203 (+) Transcript_2685:633-1241(+)
MTYAAHTDALLDRPAKQCTSTFPPLFTAPLINSKHCGKWLRISASGLSATSTVIYFTPSTCLISNPLATVRTCVIPFSLICSSLCAAPIDPRYRFGAMSAGTLSSFTFFAVKINRIKATTLSTCFSSFGVPSGVRCIFTVFLVVVFATVGVCPSMCTSSKKSSSFTSSSSSSSNASSSCMPFFMATSAENLRTPRALLFFPS